MIDCSYSQGMFSPSQKLMHILRKDVEAGYLHNVELCCEFPAAAADLFSQDEECVARVRT